MTTIGTATLDVAPRFPGLAKSVTAAFNSVNVSSIGTTAGTSYSNSMGSSIMKSGAIAGAISTITNKAISTLQSSLSGAISRFDTLNSYPRVMASLGYETSEVSDSLSLMDERLQGLPTALNDMVSTVQGLSVITGDLGKATEAGLAVNDMLLASGSNTQITTAALEQFRQMLSKGKPDMQDWKSLMSAMPGQMNQLAQAMLGAEATTDDLYTALGGGGVDATITMDELLDAVIRLDTEGGDGIESFANQAKSATGGVETSMANLQTSVTRGLSNIMDTIGQDTISGGFGDLKTAIDDTFKTVNSTLQTVMPTIKTAFSWLKDNAGTITTAVASFVAFKGVGGVIANVAPKIGNLATAFKLAAGGAGTLTESLTTMGFKLNPVTIGITAAAAAATIAVTAYTDWKTKTDNAKKATEGLDDAINRATGILDFSSTLDNVGSSANDAYKSIDELNASAAEYVDAVNERSEAAETEISQLNTAQGIIEEYTGKTDLSTEAQGKLEWALDLVNDKLGLNVSAQDVAIGKYQDQNGAVVDLKDSIYDLIEAKKTEIELDALKEDYSGALEKQQEAAASYASAYAGYDAKYQEFYDDYINTGSGTMGGKVPTADAKAAASKQAKEKADAWLAEQKVSYDDWTDTVNQLETAMGDLTVATSQSADAWDAWGNKLDTAVKEAFKRGGGTDAIASLKDDLRDLGLTTDDLASLTTDDLMLIGSKYNGTAESVCTALLSVGDITDTAREKLEAWNATNLENKTASASVSGNAVDGTAKASIDNLISSLNNLPNTTVTAQLSAGVQLKRYNPLTGEYYAAGGIRPHAEGAIVTSAVPLDIVGEDGAEAIIPLTNERYSRPFAELLAKQINRVGNVTNNYVVNGMNYLPDSMVAQAVENVFTTVAKTQRMGV